MMEHHPTIVLAVVAGLIGFGSYCATAALHVWRSRNRNASSATTRLDRLLKWAAIVVFLVGFGCHFAAFTQHIFGRHESELRGDGLAAIRARDDFEVEWMTEAESVAEGDVIVRLRSPEVEAAIEVERLKLDELQTEMAILKDGPLTLDTAVAHALAKVDNERLHASSHLDENKREQARVGRELARAKLAAEDQIHQLEVTLAELDRELAQAKSVLAYYEGEMERTDGLRRDGAASMAKYESWVRKTKVARDEIKKVDASIKKTLLQKSHLEDNLRSLAAELNKQSSDFATQVGAHQSRLARAADSEEELQQKLAAERQRAAKIRRHEIDKVQIQAKQVEAELNRLTESLVERSPIAGRIAFRALSASTTEDGDPLLVVAPENGLLISIQLPDWQRSLIRHAEALPFEMSKKSSFGQVDENSLTFDTCIGRFKEWHVLAGNDAFGLASIQCNPPAEAIESLVSGDTLRLGLEWRPPLYRNPLFVPGCLMFAASFALVGVIRWLHAWRWLPAEGSDPNTIDDSEIDTETDFSDATVSEIPEATELQTTVRDDVEIPATDNTVTVALADTVTSFDTVAGIQILPKVNEEPRIDLAIKLRESILTRALDGELLVRVASWLERDRQTATRELALQLRPSGEIKSALESILTTNDETGQDVAAAMASQRSVELLCDILGQVDPQLVLFDHQSASREDDDIFIPGRIYGP